ncbi:MAG: hypothetical protein QOG10_6968 [Kribbellaceae bacterium]|nr:hypothetical protein [Kribbellaceae bacterium]
MVVNSSMCCDMDAPSYPGLWRGIVESSFHRPYLHNSTRSSDRASSLGQHIGAGSKHTMRSKPHLRSRTTSSVSPLWALCPRRSSWQLTFRDGVVICLNRVHERGPHPSVKTIATVHWSFPILLVGPEAPGSAMWLVRSQSSAQAEIRWTRVSHAVGAVSAVFDDPNGGRSQVAEATQGTHHPSTRP